MDLSTYIATRRGAAADLARSLGVTSPYVFQWVSRVRVIPPERCPAVERATDGRVTVEELRGDICWHRVADDTWPHPQGRPTIDVAAPGRATAECQPGQQEATLAAGLAGGVEHAQRAA